MVSWTRLRHQHALRPAAVSGRRLTCTGLWKQRQGCQRKYTEKVCTVDGRAAKGGGAAGASVGEGARVDMCRCAHALGFVQGGKAALTAEHARLEAMVLRARRGTHQGSVDAKAGRREGCNARATGSSVAECEPSVDLYWTVRSSTVGGRGRRRAQTAAGGRPLGDWRAAARDCRGECEETASVCICADDAEGCKLGDSRSRPAVAERSGDEDRQLPASVRWGRPR